MTKIHVYILICIVLLASLIRLSFLGDIPHAIHPDEASWGYNAYSILQTGNDEWGESMPLIFKAFGDQKLPIYTYAIVPFIKIFGLNNLSVRLPVAIAGIILVFFVYLLLIEFGFSSGTSLFGALITATSPWLIIINRVFGHDSATGLVFFTIGLWALMKSRKSNKIRWLVIASISLGLTWYSYIAYRVVSTFAIVICTLLYFRKGKSITRSGLLLLATFFAILLPLIILTFSGSGVARFSQVSSTQSKGMTMTIDEDRGICTLFLPKPLCYFKANKVSSFANGLIGRYTKTLSPFYLFFEGDYISFLNVDGYGLLSIAVLPLYIFGLLFIGHRVITKKVTKEEIFVMSGLIFAPLASLLVSDPQKVRISGLFPFLLIVCMYGLVQINSFLTKRLQKNILNFTLVCTILTLTLFFMVDFLVIHVRKKEVAIYEPVTKLMEYLGSQDLQTPIYVKDIENAIIMYAYFKKYDPVSYQKSIVRPKANDGGFSHPTDLGNFHATSLSLDMIYCQSKQSGRHALFASNEDFVRTGLTKKYQKVIKTWDFVHSLYFVYNTKDVVDKNVDCEYLLLNKKVN